MEREQEVTLRLFARQRFFGVGQGLFTDGLIYTSTRAPARFRWVYDCGTSSSQSLIDAALVKLANSDLPPRVGQSQRIDLATLSHFDRDHISGLVRLLKSFSIDTLLLPYMPLWQRLALAFIEGVDTQQELFEFFVNPINYISQLNTELNRIILVPGGRGDRPGNAEARETPLPTEDSSWNIEVDLGDPSGTDQSEDASTFESTKRLAVQWLRPGGTLRVAGVWEFVPYNDAEFSKKAGTRFQAAVASRRAELLIASPDRRRAKALADIKNLYDRAFGKSALRRNLISLFLYSGPYPRSDLAQIMFLDAPARIHDAFNRTSTLYTGDGFLDSPKRLGELARYLGKLRLNKLGCLQVMHHGSKDNWHEGIAGKLNPRISVFSSDPEHRGLRHPHAEVLRDFWSFGPVQVSKDRDIEIGVAFVAKSKVSARYRGVT